MGCCLGGLVTTTLDKFAFEPHRLTIELTEGVLISNADQARRSIAEIRALGIKVALDDFGSGFASIGSLRQFRFDRIKLADSTIYEMEQRGQFPRRFALTPRCVVWDLNEVLTWLTARRATPIQRTPAPDLSKRRSRPQKEADQAR
jgi:prophage regulatory protein